MMTLIRLLTFGLVLAVALPVNAAKAKRAVHKVQKAKPVEQGSLGTNHSFDDHGVLGEYQMPDEALAKVENEKALTDLLGIRKHFKDRLAEASEQE